MHVSTHVSPRRPGVILLVVVVMLALFAVVGLSFVYYAESAASSSRIYREAQAPSDPGLPSETLLAWSLGQLIYGVPDDGKDPSGFSPQSAIRSHNLSLLTYGWNWAPDGSNALRPLAPSIKFNNNVVAYNGRGPTGTSTAHDVIINYQYFQADGYIRDPERRLAPASPFASRTGPDDPALTPYEYPFNVPYTYPDRTNMCLAAVNADGQVIMPSFYRPWLSPGLSVNPTPADYNNWYATGQFLKYQTLRPRPAEMYFNPSNPDKIVGTNYVKGDSHNFPLPFNGGDVKNLVGAPGGNDSIWMDLGFPVMGKSSRTGRKYKPLFAFLIVDLDGRVNINVHGNVKGTDASGQPGHASNQGLGKHEVDLSQIFIVPSAAGMPSEWTQILLGQRSSPPYTPGRYGGTSPPALPPSPGADNSSYPQPTAGDPLSYLFPLDFDATNEAAGSGANTTARFRTPSPGVFRAFPNFTSIPDPGTTTPAQGYGNYSPTELAKHPLLYNVLQPQGNDTPFNIDNMFHLIGQYDSSAKDYQNSTLYTQGLVKNNFTYPTVQTGHVSPVGSRIRNLITTHSYDLGVPGATAVATDVTVQGQYTWPLGQTFPNQQNGAFQPFSYPPPAGANLANGDYSGMPYPTTPNPTPSNDRRVPVLSRLDLNRKLTSYYDTNGVFQMGSPAPGAGQEPPPVPGFYRAQYDRQVFAREIYERLLFATLGVLPGSAVPPPTFGSDDYNARRWLAQIAVNIVDYIDDDDFITPFQWDLAPNAGDQSKGIVYGTESPKVVINEVYAEIRNDPVDTSGDATKQYKVNFWIELLNPHNSATDSLGNPLPNDPNTGLNRAAAQLQRPKAGGAYENIYQILISNDSATLQSDLGQHDNTIGTVKPNLVKAKVTTFNFAGSPPREVQPTDGQFKPTPPAGFYVIAPNTQEGDIEGASGMPPPTARVQNPDYNTPNPDGSFEGLSYPVTQDVNPTSITQVTNAPHAVVLQRLACPMLPLQPDPALPFFNPYVTVDVLPYVRVNDGVKFLKKANPLDTNPANNPSYIGVQQRKAQGRKQPYASAFVPAGAGTPPTPDPVKSQVVDQTGSSTSQPQNTLFQHNAATQPGGSSTATDPLTNPFDWLVHLDRQLVSPLELVHVSAVPPHQLTKSFIGPNGDPRDKYQHTAPWVVADITTNQPSPPFGPMRNAEVVKAARIYRALEYFTVGDRAVPSATGGRVPGMININTIWDIETFHALCSAYQDNPSNPDGHFSASHVEYVWNEILKMRSPGLVASPARGLYQLSTTPSLVQSDSPFWSFASPVMPTGSTLTLSELTLARTAMDPASAGTFLTARNPDGKTPIVSPVPPAGVPVPGVPPMGQQPYMLDELLTKIAPHITTRSNVFAVYLTVGFFEVMDDTTIPPKLGAEIASLPGIGSDVAKNFRRRRMFAIVDRTNLALAAPTSGTDATFRLRQANGTPYHLSSSVSVPQPVSGSISVEIPVPTGVVAPAANGANSMSIQYEGNTFQIHSAAESPTNPTILWVDTGIRQEPVQVAQVFPAGGQRTVPTLLINFTKAHAAGFRLCNAQLGNPGPQGPIDYNTPQYKPVVPYTYIIE